MEIMLKTSINCIFCDHKKYKLSIKSIGRHKTSKKNWPQHKYTNTEVGICGRKITFYIKWV